MQNRTSMRKRNWNISSQEYSRYLRVTPFDPKSHTGYIIHAIDSIAPLQTLVQNIVEHVVTVHVDRVQSTVNQRVSKINVCPRIVSPVLTDLLFRVPPLSTCNHIRNCVRTQQEMSTDRGN